MKLSTTLILLTALQSFAINGVSQKRINLDLKGQSIVSVIKIIEKKFDYRFFYSDSVALSRERVDVFADRATIDYVMQQILQGTSFSYKKINRGFLVIVGYENKVTTLPIKGRIVNDVGDPLPGASVIEKGTTNGIVTGEDGSFSLNVKDENALLVISAVGYVPKEISVKDSNYTNIVLAPIDAKMEEVVVVGYGTQKRQNLTSSVASVKMDNVLVDRPVTSTSQALQGALSGLQVTYGSGQPGTGTSLNIRGYTSITGGGQPLVVVDNVPMSIDDVNPRDIAEVTVLKDAAASAVYGARAAFGVIIITTKKAAETNRLNSNIPQILPARVPALCPKKQLLYNS